MFTVNSVSKQHENKRAGNRGTRKQKHHTSTADENKISRDKIITIK